MTDHKIRISGSGQNYTVHFDGHDVTAALYEISIRLPKPGVPAAVVLKGAVHGVNIESIEVDVQVTIPEGVQGVLEHFGWTPPAQDDSGEVGP